ncbi:MAG: TolC family protein [Chitinophagaceae bacterium]|nr:TolC family protein [Chitinophagaceae bacterium]
MKKSNAYGLLIALMCMWHPGFAADSTKVLSRDALMGIILKYHPVAKQAGLRVERAVAGITESRGAFDPTVKADLDRKTFDGTRYYSYFHPKLSIPTWYGIEIKAGLEEVSGDRVNSESTLGKTSYAGITIAAHGLLFDERRAVLRQAQSFYQLSGAEQQLAINDLLFSALTNYWSWVQEYRVYQVLTEALKVNEQRIRFIKTEYEQGARAAIDTVEAITQLQNIQLQQQASRLAVQNAGLALSVFLWLETGAPAAWNEQIVPDNEATSSFSVSNLPGLEQLITEALTRHPKLNALKYKTDILRIDSRLKAQYLLPKVNLNANLLNKGYTLPDKVSSQFLSNNYKLGFDVSMPLFLREARGAYRSARLKVEENEWEIKLQLVEVENKIKQYFNEVANLEKQLLLSEQMFVNAQRLYQAERTRLEVGESTLFLLNSRENKLLETAQKLQEVTVKRNKSYTGVLWAAYKLVQQ